MENETINNSIIEIRKNMNIILSELEKEFPKGKKLCYIDKKQGKRKKTIGFITDIELVGNYMPKIKLKNLNSNDSVYVAPKLLKEVTAYSDIRILNSEDLSYRIPNYTREDKVNILRKAIVEYSTHKLLPSYRFSIKREDIVGFIIELLEPLTYEDDTKLFVQYVDSLLLDNEKFMKKHKAPMGYKKTLELQFGRLLENNVKIGSVKLTV